MNKALKIFGMGAIVAMSVVAFACERDRSQPQSESAKTIESTPYTTAHFKIGPPLEWEMNREFDYSAHEAIFNISVTPTQDLEDMEFGWKIPDGAKLAKGDLIDRPKSKYALKKGETTKMEIRLAPTASYKGDKFSLTVNIKWNGKWYGDTLAETLTVVTDPKAPSAGGPEYKDQPMAPGK